MILQGDLKDFSLADLLQLLTQQRKTGTLLLGNEKDKAELTISQGNIIGVKVGGATPETRVRDLLIENGRVGRKEMVDLEAVSVSMNRPLLATLNAKGYLPEEEGEQILALASEDMVCDLFRWTEGKYEFGTAQKGVVHGLTPLRIGTDFACMEGMRRIDEWPRLIEQVTSDRMIFQRSEQACPSDVMWEKAVLELMDGRTPLSGLSKRLPFGYFRLLECVVNLWNDGCIAPIDGIALHVEAAPVADPRAQRDQKTALVLGVSALFLVVALVFRLATAWILQSSEGGAMNTPQLRVDAITLRMNASVMVLEHLSRTGLPPKSLSELVQQGDLTGYEIRGPEGGRLKYRTIGEKDFVLK